MSTLFRDFVPANPKITTANAADVIYINVGGANRGITYGILVGLIRALGLTEEEVQAVQDMINATLAQDGVLTADDFAAVGITNLTQIIKSSDVASSFAVDQNAKLALVSQVKTYVTENAGGASTYFSAFAPDNLVGLNGDIWYHYRNYGDILAGTGQIRTSSDSSDTVVIGEGTVFLSELGLRDEIYWFNVDHDLGGAFLGRVGIQGISSDTYLYLDRKHSNEQPVLGAWFYRKPAFSRAYKKIDNVYVLQSERYGRDEILPTEGRIQKLIDTNTAATSADTTLLAPVAIAVDTDNHLDGTTNKVFTAGEKTKLTGISAGADMLQDAYDPTGVVGDAFLMLNMSETAGQKVFTSTERTKLASAIISDTGVLKINLYEAEPEPTDVEEGELYFVIQP